MTTFVTVVVVLFILVIVRIVAYHLYESDEAQYRRQHTQQVNAEKAREEHMLASMRKKFDVELEIVKRLRQIPPSEWNRAGGRDNWQYSVTTARGSVAVLVYKHSVTPYSNDGRASSYTDLHILLDGDCVARARQSALLSQALHDLYWALDAHWEQPARDERARQAQESAAADEERRRREGEEKERQRKTHLDKV